MQEIKTDLLIIGAGPGGLGAALYASRAKLNFEIVEKYMAGGQIVNTDFIENYPGFKDDISGFEIAQNLVEHCRKFRVNINEYFAINSIKKIEGGGSGEKVKTDDPKNSSFDESGDVKQFKFNCFSDDKVILTKSLIIATGASPGKLEIEGEDKFIGKGISFCATCDGALYRDKIVAVVGGGDTAVEEALFLTKFTRKVYMIHRRDELRAVKILQNRAFENKKIEFLWSSTVEKFVGQNMLEEIVIKNKKNDQKYNLKVDGVFEYVGIKPNSDLVKNLVELDENNFIVTDSRRGASVEGVFAVGDVRNTPLRQVITAVADGAIAAMSVDKYLNNLL